MGASTGAVLRASGVALLPPQPFPQPVPEVPADPPPPLPVEPALAFEPPV